MYVSEIVIYPAKSLGGISLQSAKINREGFENDRQWMVVQTDGTFMTQRLHPQMALIDTAIVDGELVLSTFGMEPHTVSVAPNDAARIKTEVWGDRINAVEQDPATNEWLSQAIDTPCQLVSFPTDESRQCDQQFSNQGEHTKFADGFPLLVASRESLDDLNQRLDQPVGMDRFRPNLVVSGSDPFAEDGWKTVSVNDIDIRLVKRCARCSVPTVDQQTGALSGPEPIHTLSSYRQTNGEVFFGMNAIPESIGIIRVGDKVTLKKSSEES